MIDSPSRRKPKRRRKKASLDQVLRALNSPIRRQVLRALVDEEGSANSLSKTLGLNLGIVSYHLNKVLANECDLLELTKSVPRRGAIEKFYRLRFQAPTKGRRKGADGPKGMRKMSPAECFIVAAAAADPDGVKALEGNGWEWFLAEVDDEGWREIREATVEFNKQLEAVVERSRERVGDVALHDVVVGVAAFPSVSSPPAS